MILIVFIQSYFIVYIVIVDKSSLYMLMSRQNQVEVE